MTDDACASHEPRPIILAKVMGTAVPRALIRWAVTRTALAVEILPDVNVRVEVFHCPTSISASRSVTDVPSAIERVVMACLEKYPENRPASAEAVALEYEKVLGRKIYKKGDQSAAGSTRQQHVNGQSTRPTSDRLQALTKGLNAVDRNAIFLHVTATMPESMAMIKLKGFIGDLGAGGMYIVTLAMNGGQGAIAFAIAWRASISTASE